MGTASVLGRTKVVLGTIGRSTIGVNTGGGI
jgi:hypothetical protein